MSNIRTDEEVVIKSDVFEQMYNDSKELKKVKSELDELINDIIETEHVKGTDENYWVYKRIKKIIEKDNGDK